MMLSRLRKIEALTIKIAEEMPIHFDFETDTLYKRGQEKGEAKGIEKGIEKEKRETIIRSWLNGIELHLIANITGLSIEEVEKEINSFKSNEFQQQQMNGTKK